MITPLLLEPVSEVAVSVGWLDGKVSAHWMERRLDRGGCVVLLDGLDEVASAADWGRVVAWIRRQIQRHPRNIYVVTSRPHGYESNPLPGAEVLQVRRFTAEQISRFLHQWSYATERRAREGTDHDIRAVAHRSAEDLLTRLREQPALYDLAANPLLLTMTANVHRYRGQLPGSRAELYAEMCDVLLHRRIVTRGLRDATGLGGSHKKHVVQHLALAMMEARTRDWPVSYAMDAIRYPLQQVPGDVAPEVFLEEARKSGLLVEREHGVYGFAHLTLQEYLAAAQLGTSHGATSLLTANVQDPWWRETILLWAAGNDATDVINACLQLDSVTALALAFDCADQARIVHPDTRSRLDALLDGPAPGQDADPIRRGLLRGIQVTRTLSETIPLSDRAALCVRPIPRSLYDLFIQDELTEGRYYPDQAELGSSNRDGGAPAVGMHAQDAERFIYWLSNISGDSIYRLPTPAELSDHAAPLTVGLERHTVWTAHTNSTSAGSTAILHQLPGVPSPYTPTHAQLRSTALADRKKLEVYLWLITTAPAERMPVEKRAGVIAAALRGDAQIHEHPTVELARAVGVAFHLALARIYSLEIDDIYSDSSSSAFMRSIRGNLSGLRTAFERASELASSLAPGLGLEGLGGAHLEREITQSLRRALYLSRALHFDLNRDLEGLVAPTLDPDNTELISPADRDRARDLALALAQSFVRALDQASDISLTRTLDLDLGRATFGLSALTAQPPRHGDQVPVLASNLDSEHAYSIARDSNVGLDRDDVTRVLGLDRATALALGAQSEVHNTAVQALALLLYFWSPPAPGRRPSPLESFDSSLTSISNEPPATEQIAPEDPINTLRLAADLLESSHSTSALHSEVRSLVIQSIELLTSVHDRRLPFDFHVLACIRTAILAAVAGVGRLQHQRDAAQLLIRVWQSLATYDGGSSNQILLVVRTH